MLCEHGPVMEEPGAGRGIYDPGLLCTVRQRWGDLGRSLPMMEACA